MNTPNYYAIIPANVRYNKELSFLEKFLYCELTALSNVDGYCKAGNKYFADLYDKNVATISRALAHLEELGYITIEYDKVGCKVTKRRIYLSVVKNTNDKIVNRTETTNDKNITREQEKLLFTIDKIVKENNVSYEYILSLIMYNMPKDIKDIINSYNFDKIVEDAIYKWLYHKKEKRQTYKDTSLKELLNRLQKETQDYGNDYVVEEISNSIAQNYSGIFANNSKKQQPKKEQSKKWGSADYYDSDDDEVF